MKFTDPSVYGLVILCLLDSHNFFILVLKRYLHLLKLKPKIGFYLGTYPKEQETKSGK